MTIPGEKENKLIINYIITVRRSKYSLDGRTLWECLLQAFI